MTQVIDVIIKLDRSIDPQRARDAVNDALHALPGIEEVGAELDRPMGANVTDTVVVVLGVITAARMTIGELDALVANLADLLKTIRGFRHAIVRSDNESREIRTDPQTGDAEPNGSS